MGANTSAGFSARWQGFLRVDHPAEYQFTLVSNDVAWLSLDGRLRVNNGGYGSSRQTATVPLEAGLHAVDLAFFSRGEDFQLELLWAEGSGPATPISPDHLFPTRTASRAYDARWGQAYLWPLTGSLGIFAAFWWWPLGQVRRHCRERADDAATNRVLWLLLATSFLLSVAAIDWGLPQAITWAPDEVHPIDVTEAVAKRFSNGWHLKYPPMQLYLLAIVYAPFFVDEWCGMVDLTAVGTHAALFVLARAMSVGMAVGTVYVVYLCGLQLYRSRTAGLAAAALVATMPPFVYYAKMANVDVPYLFWFALSLLFYIRIVQADRTGDYIRFACTAALAICTKDQTYGPYVFPAAHLVWLRMQRGGAVGAWARIGAAWSDRRLRWAAFAGIGVLGLGYNLVFNLNGFLEHVAVLVGPLSQEARMFAATPAGHLSMAWEALGVLGLCLSLPGLLVCGLGLVTSARLGASGPLLLPDRHQCGHVSLRPLLPRHLLHPGPVWGEGAGGHIVARPMARLAPGDGRWTVRVPVALGRHRRRGHGHRLAVHGRALAVRARAGRWGCGHGGHAHLPATHRPIAGAPPPGIVGGRGRATPPVHCGEPRLQLPG